MTQTQIILIVSVGIYMAAMLAIGFLTSRKIHDTRDYIVAGGRLGWGFSIGTIFATWFGAETCMGSSRTAFEKGILGVIADPFGAGLCLILSGFFFAKYFRRMNYKTVIDFFDARYGRRLAMALGFLYVPVYLGWIGGQLLAFGVILQALTGIPQMLGVTIATAVVLIYTYAGGMWADSVTDFFQMIFILAGLLVLFPVILHDLGGWQAARASVPDSFFHFYPQDRSPLSWMNYVQAWMIVGIGSLPAQDLFQRIMSPKSAAVAKWSSILSGLMYIGVGLIPVLLGIFGRVALSGNTGDSVLIDLALKYLPLPLMALMIGALLSAIMSSADSALLAPAGIIGSNLVPYFKPDASEALKLKVCKGSIPAIGLVSLGLALYFQNVYTLCTQSWGILLVGVAAPLIAGMYWKKATAAGAAAGVVAGTGSWILGSVLGPPDFPAHLLGFVVSWLALVTVSGFTAPPKGTPQPPCHEVRTASTDPSPAGEVPVPETVGR